MRARQIIKSIPLVGPFARRVYLMLSRRTRSPQSSAEYWDARYTAGGNSGDGSYDQLAEFKAEILNAFVQENEIASVIEFGCGDGNQLRLARYRAYVGFDVSSTALSLCEERFRDDHTKTFKLMNAYAGETADVTLSLDVVYHLIEEDVFGSYMNRLFDSSRQYVIIYSSNTDDNPPGTAPHVKQRRFTSWIEVNRPQWKLLRYIPNRYPFRGDTRSGSISDFFIYSCGQHDQ